MEKKTFQECEAAIKQVKDLEELFALWKEAHESEDDNSFKNTSPKDGEQILANELKGIFVPDGMLGSNASKKCRILFVCRESNLSVENGKIVAPMDESEFWMKRVVDYKTDRVPMGNVNVTEKRSATKYYNCMKALSQGLGVKNGLRDCSYMNINKRGGFSGTNFSRLGKYASKYQNFIKKEIEILQPDLIVILGKFFNNQELCEVFQALQKQKNYDIRQYKWHPSVWKKWAEKSIPETLLNNKIE